MGKRTETESPGSDDLVDASRPTGLVTQGIHVKQNYIGMNAISLSMIVKDRSVPDSPGRETG